MTSTSGESLIIAWEIPKEFRVKNDNRQWAKDLKKEMKNHKRGKWAYVRNIDSYDSDSKLGIHKAAWKVFGYSNINWEVSTGKLYVRLPWWKF